MCLFKQYPAFAAQTHASMYNTFPYLHGDFNATQLVQPQPNHTPNKERRYRQSAMLIKQRTHR